MRTYIVSLHIYRHFRGKSFMFRFLDVKPFDIGTDTLIQTKPTSRTKLPLDGYKKQRSEKLKIEICTYCNEE